MGIYDFFKAVVNACNKDDGCCCWACPIQTIARTQENRYYSCKNLMFDYFIETDKEVGQKIYDDFVKLGIDTIPDFYFNGEKLYKEQLKVLEKYCKNNILEIE